MENKITMYATAYLAVPLAALAGLGYAVHHGRRRTRAAARHPVRRIPEAEHRANSVCDDRC